MPVLPRDGDFLVAVGERLRCLRTAWQMTGEAMAESVGANKSRWFAWEQGRALLDVAIACELTRYGCDLDWLYRGATDSITADFRARLLGHRETAAGKAKRAALRRPV